MKAGLTVATTCLGISMLSWLGMQLIHELGHVCGAVLTGGSVTRVILHPFTISRTDVDPNPAPGTVAWCGPLAGSVLPLLGHWIVSSFAPAAIRQRLGGMAGFFAGFCLIANGAYLLFGTADRVGDCGELLRTGSPPWTLYLFGLTSFTAGLFVWHRMGSVRRFVNSPQRTTAEAVAVMTAALLAIALELWWSGW